MKTRFGRIAKTKSILAVAIVFPLVFLIVVYLQSRYGASQESTRLANRSSERQLGNNQGKRDHIRTLAVKRLLDKLDAITDISPDDKRELEEILREADQHLAEAAAPVPQNMASKEERLLSESSKDPQTSLVRALLQLLDEVIEDNLNKTSRDSPSRDELRESLLRADHILRQYLGDSARARIEAANRKPTIPSAFNPPRKTPTDSAKN
jgi:hypothetical protein